MNTEKREKDLIKEENWRRINEYSIKVNLTEQDLYQLQGGDLYFDWSFPTEEDKNVIVKVMITTGEDKEEE